MSNQAMMMTTILGLFGLVLMALALYQWTLILQQRVDIERVRRESADHTLTASSNGLASTVSSARLTPESAVDIEGRRQMSSYLSDVEPLVLMWRDAQSRAGLADSTSMVGALNTLREVESRIATVIPPADAQPLHDRLLAGMRRVVEEYEAANRNRVEGAVAVLSDEAREEFDKVARELASLEARAE